MKPAEDLSHDEEVGYNIVLRACRSPLTHDRRERRPGRRHRLRTRRSKRKGNDGYNAATDKYEDLVKAGVIDPTKVTRTALQNAASVATLLLTSDALIAESPRKTRRAAAATATAAWTTCINTMAVAQKRDATSKPQLAPGQWPGVLFCM